MGSTLRHILKEKDTANIMWSQFDNTSPVYTWQNCHHCTSLAALATTCQPSDVQFGNCDGILTWQILAFSTTHDLKLVFGLVKKKNEMFKDLTLDPRFFKQSLKTEQ